MRDAMIVCPACYRGHAVTMGHDRYSIGGINCDCGTVITFQIDAAHSREHERLAELKRQYKNGASQRDAARQGE